MNKGEIFGYILFVFALILLGLVLPISDIVLAAYYQSSTNKCAYYVGASGSCGSPTNYCATSYYYPTQSCSQSPAYTTCQVATSSGACLVCGNCAGSADTCGTATCGTNYGCASGICDGVGTGANHCLATFGTGAACNCSGQCTSGVCTSNLCKAKYQSGTNQCGYYTGTSASCGAANNFCTTSTYYPSQACSATPTYTVCQTADTTHSCGGTVCGMCSGSADTCGTATCGTTYGCASGICDGVGTGANHCLATFTTGAACNCSGQCTSGVCTSNLCKAKYQSGTNLCGYYTGTSSSCGAANTYCTAGNYYPTQACSATPTYTVCQAESSSGSCAVCGDCTGSGDTCGTAACGTTYGCSGGKVCNGQAKGASYCVALAYTGEACLCNAMCASGVCNVTSELCVAKYQSGTNLCGYYTGISSSCGAANIFCTSGNYYPTQACSATPTYTSCQSETSSASCAVCGDCAGGADTCNNVTCGTTNSYGCGSGSYCNGATGAGSCNAPFGTGAACNCSSQCTSGVCTGNLCQAKYQSGTNLCGYYTGTSSSCGAATNYCAAGTYYPTQSCSATPTYTSCQTGYCAVCGDCAGDSDSCSTKTCGTTGYGCAGGSICDGQGTGASHCNAIGGLGTTCYCVAQCQSGLYCIGNVCTLLNYSSNSTNSTFAGTPIRHNLYWQETGGGASGYIFRFCNGTWDGSNCLTATTGWLYGWLYRKQHNITGSTVGAQTNYQIRFKVYNTTGTDSGENVYLGSEVNSNFLDVRFTNSTGSLLTYWIENTSTNYATVWVNVDSIPASPNSATIYIYYGNSSATNASNGSNTFSIFDDFSSNSFANWNVIDNSASICNANSGYARLGGYYSGGYTNCKIRSIASTSGNVTVDFDVLYATECDEYFIISAYNGTDNSEWGICANNDYCAAHPECGSGSYVGCCFGTCGVLISSTEHYSFNITNITATYNLGLNGGGQWCYSGHTENEYRLDNVRVRKYVLPEPSHGNWGSEVSDTWIADSWVQFTSGMCSSPYAACWSNVTKTVNSSVGATIAWCVLANDTSNNWNTTSCTTPFAYTTTAPPAAASVSTDNTSYTACGTVFYKVKLYDQNSRLLNSYFTLNVINPSLSTVSTVGSAYPNNGTGIFTGNYTLNSSSPLGTWLLKVLESGGATSGKNFFVATTCGDKICADGENIDNCPGDCPV